MMSDAAVDLGRGGHDLALLLQLLEPRLEAVGQFVGPLLGHPGRQPGLFDRPAPSP